MIPNELNLAIKLSVIMKVVGVFLTLKFPILSAIIPASGGIKIATTGVTADIIAVSSTLIPSSRIWMVKYGYSTRIAENKSNFG